MAIQMSEREYEQFMARIAEQRRSGDDKTVAEADVARREEDAYDSDRVAPVRPVRRDRDDRPARRRRAGGGDRGGAVDGVTPRLCEQAARGVGTTPRAAICRVWTCATVLALVVLVLQVGQLADVPGPLLLCATLWVVVAWLTRRRSSKGMRGFWWGALLGASVESVVGRGR